MKSEPLDLLSFASLAVSHDHDISEDIKGWYKKYFHILNTLGLVITTNTMPKALL